MEQPPQGSKQSSADAPAGELQCSFDLHLLERTVSEQRKQLGEMAIATFSKMRADLERFTENTPATPTQ